MNRMRVELLHSLEGGVVHINVAFGAYRVAHQVMGQSLLKWKLTGRPVVECDAAQCDVCQPDSPPDEDDYSCDDGGKEHEPAEYSQSYNASCKLTIFVDNYSNNMTWERVIMQVLHWQFHNPILFHCICIIVENSVPRLSCACCRDSPVPPPPCSLWCLPYKRREC